MEFDGLSQDEVLELTGRTRWLIKPDGNCQFGAIAHQVFGNAAAWRDIRTLCYNFVEKNWLFLQDEVTCSKSALLKCLKHQTDQPAPTSKWGNEATLAICSYALERRIVVLHPGECRL